MIRVGVVRHGPFGSDPRVTKEVAALARTPSVAVDVFARGPEPAQPGARAHRRVRVHSVSAAPASDRPIALAGQAVGFGLRVLGSIVRARPRFDVLVIHSIPSWLVLLLWPAKLVRPGTRILLDHHEPEAEMLAEAGFPERLGAVYRGVERAALRAADGVIDVSEPMRRRSERMGARRQIVVDNVPAIRVRADSSGGRVPRHELAVFGSLIPRYDLPALAGALSALGRPVSIVQVGRGPARLGANPTGGRWSTFDYLDPRALQTELLHARFGFVGLAPSRFTELVSPNRLWELSALGVPAIVAHTDLIRGLLGPDAIYYEGGSWRSLRDAVTRAMDMDEAERQAIGRAARRRVRSRLWPQQSDAFVAFCLDGHRATTLGSPSIARPLKPIGRGAEGARGGGPTAAIAAHAELKE